MKALGLFLILLGCVALGYQGFTYVGQDYSSNYEPRIVPLYSLWLPPVTGGLCILAGFGILAAMTREKAELHLG